MPLFKAPLAVIAQQFLRHRSVPQANPVRFGAEKTKEGVGLTSDFLIPCGNYSCFWKFSGK
jgi:hypothetical protein